jgi:hypothetical protein
MTLQELRLELAVILSEEEARNWDCVEFLSDRLASRLTAERDTPNDYPVEGVIGYLVGYTRRQADDGFAEQQVKWMVSYLRGH